MRVNKELAELYKKINVDIYRGTKQGHLIINIHSFLEMLLSKMDICEVYDPFLDVSSPTLLLNEINLSGKYISNDFKEIVDILKLKDVSQKNGLFDIEASGEQGSIVTFYPSIREKGSSIIDLATLFTSKENKFDNLIVISTAREIFGGRTKENLFDLVKPSAIFEIDSNLIYGAGVQFYMAILKNDSEFDDVFMASIKDDEKHNIDVCNNYFKRKTNKDFHKGVIVNLEDVNTIRKMELKNSVEKKFNRIKLSTFELHDLAVSIRRIKTSDATETPENCIYFSPYGKSKVLGSLDEYNKIPREVFQIVLDKTKVYSEYLIGFLNSNLGRDIREVISRGNTIEFLSIYDLKKLKVKVPSLNTQYELVRLSSKIQRNQNKLDSIDYEMWNSLKINKLREYNRMLEYGEKSKHDFWMESLPFPVSAILWNYKSAKENEKKIEFLLYFFESFSEMTVIIILSYLYNDKDYYSENKNRWLNDNKSNQEWYKRSTFGQWNLLLSKLQKHCRELDKDKRNEIFLYPSSEFYKLLSKDVFASLQKAKDIRNHYKGHSGVKSLSMNKKTLTELESILSRLTESVGFAFTDTKLFTLKNIEPNEEGLHNCSVFELAGSRYPFNEVELDLRQIVYKGALYLNHFNSTDVVKVLPYLKVNISTGASYFYLSLEGDKTRWISYHYSTDPENYYDLKENMFDVFR